MFSKVLFSGFRTRKCHSLMHCQSLVPVSYFEFVPRGYIDPVPMFAQQIIKFYYNCTSCVIATVRPCPLGWDSLKRYAGTRKRFDFSLHQSSHTHPSMSLYKLTSVVDFQRRSKLIAEWSITSHFADAILMYAGISRRKEIWECFRARRANNQVFVSVPASCRIDENN